MAAERRRPGGVQRAGLGSALVLGAVLAVFPAPSAGQGSPADESPKVRLGAVLVEPRTLAPETLCELRVEVINDTETVVDALAFEVRVGGQSLSVYESQLFLDPVDPGTTKTLRLFNFWSSETGRPMPRGAFVVEVELLEAQHLTLRTVTEKDERGEEVEVVVWEAQGAVEGLPQKASVQLEVTP